MQTENIYRKEEANLKTPDEFADTREHAKLEGRLQGEEEQAGSQPSTIQSLNDVSDRETPSSKDNVGSLGQVKESIKEGVANIQGDIKQKADEFKGKLTEKFGEEVQPEKDLAPESKQHVKEINEEIRHHSHGEEQIVEGQGHARAQPQDQNLKEGSKDILNKASGKMDEFKQQTQEWTEKAKGKLTEKFGEEVQPEKDLAPESKQHVKEINEEIRHHSHGKEQVVEGQGHAQGQQGESQLPDLRFAPKEVVDKAIDKFEEVIHKGEELKKDVKQKVEEKAPQSDSHQNQPTTHEGHEHHQLSAESRSFVPTQETHQLIEKVKEGLEESVPLTEKIEELEHEKQQQEKEQPVKEQIKQSIQGASDYVADKVQEVKQDVSEKKEEIVEERKPLVDKIMGRIHEVTDTFHHKVEEVKSAFKVEERQEEGDRKPLLDVVQEGISKITHNLEAAPHKIMPGQKNITE